MRELSVFVDESGDFGPLKNHTPFYIFSMVFHDQSLDITPHIKRLEEKLVSLGLAADHCIHTGPIIRRENEYKFIEIGKRRKILNALIAFSKSLNITYMSFCVEKRQVADSVELTVALSRQLSRYIQSNLQYFQAFDKVIIYYDNGQIELSRILASVFSSLLFNVEFRRVLPADYRLFQVADMCCTLELEKVKLQNKLLTDTELKFFGSARDLRKNYIKPMESFRFKIKNGAELRPVKRTEKRLK